jgi:hypothetical protein
MQFVPHRKHITSPLRRHNQLMLFRETNAVCCRDHAKPKIQCGRILYEVEFLKTSHNSRQILKHIRDFFRIFFFWGGRDSRYFKLCALSETILILFYISRFQILLIQIRIKCDCSVPSVGRLQIFSVLKQMVHIVSTRF